MNIDHYAENVMVGLKLFWYCRVDERKRGFRTHTLMSELYEDISLHMMAMSVVCCCINTPFSAAGGGSSAS